MSDFDFLFKSMKLVEKSLCIMTSVVVLFTYQIKLNISTRKRVATILPKKLHCYFTLSLRCNKKTLDKISLHKHFKHFFTILSFL